MNKKLIFLIVAFISIICFSQEKRSENKIDFAFSSGLIAQGNLFADVNIVVGKVTVELNSKVPIVGIEGFRIGFESNFRNNEDYTIAPKIGYEISPMFFTLRLSAINYFQNGNSEFRILPELGLSIGGWINLTYGYGVALKSQNLSNVSNHRISISFNFNKRLRMGTFKLLHG